ncbi:M23 family metallopeptidase [Fodinibius sediminis]|uniref:Peptidase family M23 n=1 Tax=Fodinibius sediminis TaxID=1214077 RepID=A0A521B7D9_9BACT|nr:M23 family metallopeptidase [Fodinibius sediminis]SMO43014.1 Peptidase family M23 [Fodinibius sediminis]
MFDFLRQLFHKRDRGLTFVIFDDREPEPSNSYRFKPANLLYLLYGSLAAVAILVFVLLKFTPVSGLFFSHTEKDLREQAIAISEQVRALQDSLHARDLQLAQMKRVIGAGEDTVFQVDRSRRETVNGAMKKKREPEPFSVVKSTTDSLRLKNEVVLSDIFKGKPVFPTGYPLDGTLTRGFNPGKGHFGVDIATENGTPFKAIADGAVVDQNWTLNFGWVLYVQHSDNMITVYKHAESLSKSVGDIVTKGDILGTAGNTGIMSSGPHLHLEIWQNGIPQNPNSYLIKS